MLIKRKKNILIISEDPKKGLHDTTLTTEAKYSINFTQSNKKFCLSSHYSGAVTYSYLFVNGISLLWVVIYL